MTRVAILPLPSEKGKPSYRAVSGDKQSEGQTIGQALDGLTSQLTDEENGTLVIVQNFHEDALFTAEQQQRLTDLMTRWRAARDNSQNLPPHEQAELEALVDAELRASGTRAARMQQLP